MKIESAQINLVNKHDEKRHIYEKRTEITRSTDSDITENSVAKQLEDAEIDDELGMNMDAKMYILKLLVQRLTGKEVKWYEDVIGKDISHHEASQMISRTQNSAGEQNPPTQVMVERFIHESQSNALKVGGQIKLENGKQLNFLFKAEFEQSYTSYHRAIENVNMKDPLVISFTNRAVELDKEDMHFDIDGDGKKDQFAHLKKGYGYLALDLNQNNKVDDGTELFGALSGNGFSDLARYDEDQNGFIDEHDSIFDSLRVWVKNKDEDKLISLEEAKIGAVSVANVQTPLNIRQFGELKGAVRKSGFYLSENGTPGLIQQVDYVV
ncbi:hypothetical protein J8M20_01795 [Pseudoalteromonas luteoviolacea]|uniref:hypothetical protein n=1 Tax=Pseudoalteromonas luteoviolacea TaxID=43657 RepID=UPI001B368397|nr:hypothetical protein [Pseudoalteromonas luteoviolacea]MBQ4810043.1 hypothetical protein [Pseudoalteromonas luteoviolacea]